MVDEVEVITLDDLRNVLNNMKENNYEGLCNN